MAGRPDMATMLTKLEDSRHIVNNTATGADGWSSGEGGADDDDENDDDDIFCEPPPKDEPTQKEGDEMQTSFLGGTTTGCGLFVPDSKFDIDADEENKRPEMPDLPIQELPPDTKVWVVDDHYVRMQLNDAWEQHLKRVCGGRAVGVVVRHQERLTLVQFTDNATECTYTETLPRRCLSKEYIEPIPAEEDEAIGISINVGGLGPRAGRAKEKRKEEIKVLQQFCELIDAGSPAQRHEAAWALFLKRKFEDAVAQFTQHLDELSEEEKESRVEVLTWRSMALYFNGNISKSLTDALKTIDLNPSWVWGYVRAARAYIALGKLPRSIDLMNQASLLAPQSSEIQQTQDLLYHLKTLQRRIDTSFLTYRLDMYYARRLIAARGFQPGDVIFTDDSILVGAPSIENNSCCCDFCMLPAATMETIPSLKEKGKKVMICGPRCLSRTKYFLPLEMDVASRSFEFAYTMMQNKASSSADVLSVERARLATRLFYYVYSKLKLHGKALPGSSTTSLLRQASIYPIPSCELDNKTKDDLEAVHNVITNFMPLDDRQVYGKEMLMHLYNYVIHYAVHIEDRDKNGVPVSGYLIAATASCVDRVDPANTRPNCRIAAVGNGKVAIIATREILNGDRLSIPMLRKGRAL